LSLITLKNLDLGPTWKPWHLSWYPIQPPVAPNPPPSKRSLPYPIYNVKMNLDAHVHMFCKATHANGEKNDVNIVNLFCLTLHDAISKWGFFFMKSHPICKFEELEVAFYKRH